MKHHVRVGASAKREIAEAYQWLLDNAPRVHAVAWLDGLQAAVRGLDTMPNRHGLAREAKAGRIDVRQLLYGKRPHVYRVLFIVSGDTVHVLHVRHAARNQLRRGELDLPPDA